MRKPTQKPAETDELELTPPPQEAPGEDLFPVEAGEDPRARSRRRPAAGPEVLEEAPHAVDFFSSMGSVVRDTAGDSPEDAQQQAANRQALADRIVARLNPEQARAVTTTEGPLLI
ncbi:MAG TPA: hypothetical protein VG106_08160, partial [Vicinamibacterales bacterium]|nr:hypothetical protein [Vicinamibacterales bacterium]